MQGDPSLPPWLPSPTPGRLRAVLLALMVHALLISGLSVGIAWKRDTPAIATVQAELWSAVPQEAAPLPPPPPEPSLAPTPPSPSAEPPVAESAREAPIAVEKRKKDSAKKPPKDPEPERKKPQDNPKETSREKDKTAPPAHGAESKKREELRRQNIARMSDLAGSGDAAKASGPSADYAAKIAGRIKPNIVFTDDIAGNPRVEVLIRLSPSGHILNSTVTQPSGSKAWDEAVLRAIEKTEVLPKDSNGTVLTSLQMGFRPKD